MTLSLPLIFNLGPTELIIILVIVLLLFGGSRLAGLGKSSGRALKEFKEETRGLRDADKPAGTATTPPAAAPTIQPQVGTGPQVVNGNVVPTPQNTYPATPPAATTQPQNAQPQNTQPQNTYPQYPSTPSNLADPSAPDARRDV